jgi:hypothetical protein
MTTPTDPAAAAEETTAPALDLDQATREALRRITVESRRAQGLPAEITDPGVLHLVARLILDARND